MSKNKPRAILLNGTSCAGKSSVARCVLQKLDHNFEYLVWDDFLANQPENTKGSSQKKVDLVGLFIEEALFNLQQGRSLIMDVVCVPVDVYQRLVDNFKDYELLSVRIKANPAVLRQREDNRPDRKSGQAEAQFQTMHIDCPHPDTLYDLEIDSAHNGVEDVAQNILDKIFAASDHAVHKNNINCFPVPENF